MRLQITASLELSNKKRSKLSYHEGPVNGAQTLSSIDAHLGNKAAEISEQSCKDVVESNGISFADVIGHNSGDQRR